MVATLSIAHVNADKDQKMDQRVEQRPDQRVEQRVEQRPDQRVEQRVEQRPDQKMDQRVEQRAEQRSEEKMDHRREDVQREAPMIRPPENKVVNRPVTREMMTQKNQDWSKRGKDVRNHFRDYRKNHHVFDKHYWDNYYHGHNYWHFHDNMNWWAVATWPTIGVWFSNRWESPIYYYYGDDGVVYYSPNGSSYDLSPVPSSSSFIAKANAILRNMPKIDPSKLEWMPLGIFSLETNRSNDNPNDYFTIAVSKEGIVGGAYVDPSTDEEQSLEGYVDQDSQRVVWRIIGQDLPIYETGIYNLTKDETTVLIHESSGRPQVGTLVRLQE